MYRIYAFVIVLSLVLVSGCTSTTHEASDPSLTNVVSKGVLVVGAIPDYPPMESIDETGNLVGYDIDLVREIAAEIDVTPEFRQIAWGDLFDAVKSGEVDMIISAITITPERSETMLFSVPYFDAGQVITVKKENTDINGPEDLMGKRVGVQSGTTCEEAALQYVDEVVGYESYDPIIADLKEGNVDALVTDLIGSTGHVKNNPELKIVGEPFTQEYYGIATKLGNDALMERVNEILREMKRNGKLDELKTKWLG